MAERKLPKSLHTVTVLVNVARLLHEIAGDHEEGGYSIEEALDAGLKYLKLDELDDVYNLREAALKKLEK